MSAEHFTEVVFRELAHYLGPHTARSALRTSSRRALNRDPEALGLEDARPLLDALRPMLRTLLGQARCEDLISNLNRELHL